MSTGSVIPLSTEGVLSIKIIIVTLVTFAVVLSILAVLAVTVKFKDDERGSLSGVTAAEYGGYALLLLAFAIVLRGWL